MNCDTCEHKQEVRWVLRNHVYTIASCFHPDIDDADVVSCQEQWEESGCPLDKYIYSLADTAEGFST